MRAAGLVLAAGNGTRLGQPKALVEVGGVRLVDRAIAVLAAGGAEPVFVVVGAAGVELVDACVVPNREWPTGMASSLRVGLAAITAHQQVVGTIDAAVISLVDLVGVTAESVRRVVSAVAGGARMAAATYDGVRGHPVVIRREDWPDVMGTAHGDVGARYFLSRNAVDVVEVPCGDVSAAIDIDTEADLAAARARYPVESPQR